MSRSTDYTLTAPRAGRWHWLFMRDAVLTGTPAARRHIALLFGPPLMLVVLLRLLQLSLIGTGGRTPLSDLLLGVAPPPFFIGLAVLLAAWWVRLARPRLRTIWIVSGALLLGAGLLSLAAHLLPPWLVGWITPEAFEAVRGDVLVLVLLALGSLAALERLAGWPRRVFLAVLHVGVLLLAWLPIVELSSIRALGAAPDWSMLVYTATHLGELAPVLASEATPAHAALLLLPVLLTLLPFVGQRRPAASPGTRSAWPALVATLPLLVVLAVPPTSSLPSQYRTISYAGMVRSMMDQAAYEPEGLDELATTMNAAFDAEHTRLVPTDSTRRMNVVVILLESFRSRSLTPYEPTLNTTPFLDSLARHGRLVEQMYAVVSYTNKSLAPILAGIYPEPSFHVVEGEMDALPGVGLPELLRPFGYRSAFFTPAMLSFERKDRILDHLGFEAMYGDGDLPTANLHKTHYFGYEDRIVLEPSMEWVDAVTASGDPFFLTYLTLTAHHDYQTPPDFPRVQYPVHDEELNDYLNALRYTDDFLRDLFAAFEARSLLDSTLFVLLGDHGEAFGEHGLRTHGDVLWDEALHIPALLYNPVLFSDAARIEGPRQYIDVLPTIVDALGFRLEGGTYPGHSLLRPVPEDRVLYHNAKNSSTALALRKGSLKFMYYHRRKPMEVYDLRTDPLEGHDIASQFAPEHLAAVELQLLLWRRAVQQHYARLGSEEAALAAR